MKCSRCKRNEEVPSYGECWSCILTHCCMGFKKQADIGVFKGKKCPKHGVELKHL